jgi:hypothetical protein
MLCAFLLHNFFSSRTRFTTWTINIIQHLLCFYPNRREKIIRAMNFTQQLVLPSSSFYEFLFSLETQTRHVINNCLFLTLFHFVPFLSFPLHQCFSSLLYIYFTAVALLLFFLPSRDMYDHRHKNFRSLQHNMEHNILMCIPKNFIHFFLSFASLLHSAILFCSLLLLRFAQFNFMLCISSSLSLFYKIQVLLFFLCCCLKKYKIKRNAQRWQAAKE